MHLGNTRKEEKHRDTTGITSTVTEHYLSHVLSSVKHLKGMKVALS